MKTAAFHELLDSVRDAGAYLKGTRKAIVRVAQTSSKTGVASRTKSKRS